MNQQVLFPNLTKESNSFRVLVVESDSGDMELLAKVLQRHGYKVETASTGGEALQAYEDADFVLLEMELHDLDGLEVCRSIRLVSSTPIIAVTSRSSELDRVLGLQAGLDDYVVKPYAYPELMARMDAVMRRVRPQAAADHVISHGPLSIDTSARRVQVDGCRLDLTRKEFELLLMLASKPDTVIPRKLLMEQVWGDSWSRRTIDTHVSSLRSKLGDRDWITTVRGVGFRFRGLQ